MAGKMNQYLKDCDAAASGCLEDHRGALASLFNPDEFQKFEHQVQGYAFGEAQFQLQQAMKGRGL